MNTSVTFSGYNITQEKSEEIIDVISIDNFLDGNPITFLKSDIEGEEFNMLKGAENTIKKYKPKMAISVYHRPDDLLTIPKYIKELVPEYNFSLRHHSLSFNDTVLYCWVNKN
ncbi:FkbM family methyltransferase [Brachyspira alvinipulli]|uniref:FkbM family methyltransferase n=1 Tax=Brachyspira alvinipulli TaxID=84379 RepID=UPI00300743E8